MQTNRYKATLTLGVSALLFLISLPFAATLGGGFIFSACSAALVGGMADWFAVTALFRRPMGIAFRTAIIPRNRDRILSDIVDLVENRLLTKEHVKEQIARHNMTSIVIEYLEQADGRSNLHLIIQKLMGDLLDRVKPTEIALVVETLVKRYAQSVSAAPLVIRILRWSIDQGYDKKVVKFLLDEMIHFCQMPSFAAELQVIIEKAKETYTAGQNRRKLAIWLLDSSGMSTQTMCDVMLRKMISYFEAMKQPEASLWADSQIWLEKFIRQLETDPRRIEQMEQVKQTVLNHLQIRKIVSDFIRQEIDSAQGRQAGFSAWQQRLDIQLDKVLDGFISNLGQQEKTDKVIKAALLTMIDRYHHQVGTLVRENLNAYTNDNLVEFIESKVGDDLQMIRINGSVVGGLVGMLLHLINLIVK
jgi:uncharacterized membrane-anchored protein YjiN (DUF445 family)